MSDGAGQPGVDSQVVNVDRRRFLGATAAALAAAPLGINAASAQSATADVSRVPAIRPGTNTT